LNITRLKIKVVPGASRSGICGWLDDHLKVRISQPPEKGKANAALEAIICQALNLPAGSAKVVAGTASTRKTLEIHGLSPLEVEKYLGKPGNRRHTP
jgi:uncharacterized protein (TIGR00251 family)